MGLCEFETSLVYRVSTRTVGATQGNPVSKKNKKKQKSAFETVQLKGIYLI